MTIKYTHPVNDEVQSSDAATWTYRLPKEGALHTIMLGAACTNGATGGRAVSIFDVVDTIEVVADGSKVLYSLTPREIEKRYETEHGHALNVVQSEAAAAVQRAVFPIMFGRKLYDAPMFLPLSRYNDVQLRVTYSPTIAADGGFATGTTTFDVQLIITPQAELPSYLGTLITKTIKAFTSAASGDDATKLSLLNRIRNIGIYAYEANVSDLTDITRVLLRANAGDQILFDADILQFYQLNRELFGAEIVHTARLFAQDNDTFDTRIGNIAVWDISIALAMSDANDTFSLVNIDAYTGDRVVIGLQDADITAGAETFATRATDTELYITTRSFGPSYFGLIPFMYVDAPEGYLNTLAYSELEVVLTQGGAGADTRISTQELEIL